MIRLSVLALVALLSGCGTVPRALPHDDADAYLALAVPAPRKGEAGGVFVTDAPWSLTSDARAFRPGDVLTVVLQETTQASKKADTSFGKEASASIAPTILGQNVLQTNASLAAEREFSGTASSTQQNTLQGAITVIVQEVLPNGLLRIAGEKSLYLNQGEEFVRLSGYVRAADIDTDNRVSSQRVANARIAYSGRGALADSNAAGWLTRVFNSPWMPF